MRGLASLRILINSKEDLHILESLEDVMLSLNPLKTYYQSTWKTSESSLVCTQSSSGIKSVSPLKVSLKLEGFAGIWTFLKMKTCRAFLMVWAKARDKKKNQGLILIKPYTRFQSLESKATENRALNTSQFNAQQRCLQGILIQST